MIDANEGERSLLLLSPGNLGPVISLVFCIASDLTWLEEIEDKLSKVYRELAKYRNYSPEDLSEFEGELKDTEDSCFDILNLLRASEKKFHAFSIEF